MLREYLLNREDCRAIQHKFLKAGPGKIDIKRRGSDILFVSLTIRSLLKCDYDVVIDFCVDSFQRHSKSAMSHWPQKDDEIDNVYQVNVQQVLTKTLTRVQDTKMQTT